DDEKNIRATLALALEGAGCTVGLAATAESALAHIASEAFDLALVDLKLVESSGLDLIPRLAAESPGLEIVVITAYATIDTAVEAMRRGAADYLAKPFTPAQIRHLVERGMERRALVRRVRDLEGQLADAVPELELATRSASLQAALDTVRRAAASDAAVLLRGENGTGKGVLARLLHASSRRRGAPFVVVHCPTLSEELLASELFGHTRGAFTGAVKDQPGKVEAADGGTLFLDEIAEIAPTLQAKLLRFLQDKEFERVGETATRRADVRVVSATNRDLEADVAVGRFREDLLYRLNVIEVAVPALRERREDIVPLARHFMGFFARAAKRPLLELSADAEAALLRYDWPGNVRELRNAMERAVVLMDGRVLEASALPRKVADAPPVGPGIGGDFSLDDVEREHIRRVLLRAGSLDEAARILGIDPSTLWRKRKRYDI
ncbi:MAG TPA: sigma-54 dependent transcriptional regulator, partial [Vicinamibacteria bacterium]|nr:sigma-54 dependent transcriptional regulator [Vicinamibacteria bacterium]